MSQIKDCLSLYGSMKAVSEKSYIIFSFSYIRKWKIKFNFENRSLIITYYRFEKMKKIISQARARVSITINQEFPARFHICSDIIIRSSLWKDHTHTILSIIISLFSKYNNTSPLLFWELLIIRSRIFIKSLY